MKHIIVVLSIILSVLFLFFYPSIENATDGSFNDYEYLQKLRRTRTDVNTDDKSKGWQEDGTFNPWYQKGNGSEDDKALNNIKTSVPVPSNVVPSNAVPSTTSSNAVPSTTPSKSSSDETNKTTNTNLIPYLLLALLLMIIILIVYIKYNYVSFVHLKEQI
jgi:hypothetical protein